MVSPELCALVRVSYGMRLMFAMLALALAVQAGVDGTWTAQTQAGGKKYVLDLKTKDSVLTGNVTNERTVHDLERI